MTSSLNFILCIAVWGLTACSGGNENYVISESKIVNPASKTLDTSSKALTSPSGAPNSAILIRVPKTFGEKGLAFTENTLYSLNGT
jgi:hypothetical protein